MTTEHAEHPSDPAAARGWVPVRSLGTGQRQRLAAHLLALDERSRYLRFGYPASDEQIVRYVAGIDFDRDEVFGIHNRRLELVGFAHLAFGGQYRGEPAAEFGVSVLPRYRGRGFGQILFSQAMLRARNHGVRLLLIYALSENAAMLAIARKAGATVQRDGSESEAWLRLPPASLASQVDEVLGERAAALDYGWKSYARQLGSLMGGGHPEQADGT